MAMGHYEVNVVDLLAQVPFRLLEDGSPDIEAHPGIRKALNRLTEAQRRKVIEGWAVSRLLFKCYGPRSLD